MNTCGTRNGQRKVEQTTFSLFSTASFDEFPKAEAGVLRRPSEHRFDHQEGGSCTTESVQALAYSH